MTKTQRNLMVMACLVAGALLGAGLGGCDKDPVGGEDAGVDGGADAGADATLDASPDAAADPFELDEDRIFDDVAWLAHDDRAGREPGTPGNAASLDYVETLFTDLGLTPAGDGGTYRQAFQFDHWELTTPSTLSVDGVALAPVTQFITLSYSGSASALAEVVFVGYGLTVPAFDPATHPNCPLEPGGYDDYAGVDVTDKVALILRHGPSDDQDVYDHCPANAACVGSPCLWNFGYKTANAQLHGAVAALIVQDYRHAADDLINGTIDIDYHQPDVAGFFVHRGPVEAALPQLQTWADTIDASALPNPVETGVFAEVRVQSELATLDSTNLLALAEGTDPQLADEVIVVSAHVDHLGVDVNTGAIYNGADDNASGTAVMMELARGVAHPDFQPARSVLFAAWNAEEVGLVGSCHFVAHPTVSLPDVIAMFSIDMVGAGNATGVQAWYGAVPSYLWLMQTMQGAVDAQGWSYSVQPRPPLDASDHYCFVQAGVQGVLIDSLGDHGFYHTPDDDIAHVTAADLGVAASVMWATLETLALGLEDQYVSSPKPDDAPVAPPPPDALHPYHRDR